MNEATYPVAPTPAGPGLDRGPRSEAISAALAEIKTQRKDRRKLLQLWKQRPRELWSLDLRFYATMGECLCLHGEAFAAIDVCQEGLRYFPGQVRLIQLKAWGLAQSGATETSRHLLESLTGGEGSAETWSLRARTWKDLAAVESDPVRKRELLAVACQHYEQGYQHSVDAGAPDYYPAINCATLQFRLGQPAAAREWAARSAVLAAREPREFWAEATLGEAGLLLGEVEKARQHYALFSAECGGQRAAIASARRQAAEILGSKQAVQTVLGQSLPLPPVSLFASGAEIPPDQSGAVVLCPWTPQDAQRVTALLEAGVEVHLVLAFPLERFAPGQFDLSAAQRDYWGARAASITVAHPQDSRLTEELAGFCALLQVGRARRLADTWSTELHFPPPPAVAAGPTRAYQSTLLALYERRQVLPDPCVARSMVFLDVVGYGQLDEPRVAYFQQVILPRVAEFLQTLASPPMFVQAWGDALYLGFSGVREGGVAVLALRQFFLTIPWQENGFERPLKLRTGIHSGPVLTLKDPFTGGLYFTGTVVSRAARIEPLADENQVFCSDAFAAVAAALEVREFSLTFAGTYLLPKNAGEEPLFRMVGGSEPGR